MNDKHPATKTCRLYVEAMGLDRYGYYFKVELVGDVTGTSYPNARESEANFRQVFGDMFEISYAKIREAEINQITTILNKQGWKKVNYSSNKEGWTIDFEQ
jgi:hypothetical protein